MLHGTFRIIGVAILGTLAVSAEATPGFQIIDRGVPTDGARVMTGYRGYLVRAVSDIGPIERVDLSSSGPSLGFYGDIAQRWTDPNGQGNYTQTSPGPLPFDNTTPSVFNFDSHFLGDPAQYTVAPTERASSMGFSTALNPIASDGAVGYGDDPRVPPLFSALQIDHATRLEAALIPPTVTTTIDVAYIVTNSAVNYGGNIFVGGSPYTDGNTIAIPEPAGLAAIALACLGLRRPHRRRRPTEVSCQVESLEKRQLLSVDALRVEATFTSPSNYTLHWDGGSGDTTIFHKVFPRGLMRVT